MAKIDLDSPGIDELVKLRESVNAKLQRKSRAGSLSSRRAAEIVGVRQAGEEGRSSRTQGEKGRGEAGRGAA